MHQRRDSMAGETEARPAQARKISLSFEEVVLGTIALEWLMFLWVALLILGLALIYGVFFPGRLAARGAAVPEFSWRIAAWIIWIMGIAILFVLWAAKGLVEKQTARILCGTVLFSAVAIYSAAKTGNLTNYANLMSYAVGLAVVCRWIWSRIRGHSA